MTHLPNIYQPGGDPMHLAGELLWAIEAKIAAHPRSLQERIGPSEIGIPCARRIGYRLLGVEAVNDSRTPWKPTIGTAVHTWLEDVLTRVNRALGENEVGPRFLLEHHVNVGEINGEQIDGPSDVYDRVTGTVVDFKVVGGEQLRKYKQNGPGDQYRVQTHLYGRGWRRRGMPVDTVAILFLPRDRELREAHFWHEPYDENLAVKALERADGIAKLTTAAGRAALPLLPTADAWCVYCPHFMPAATDPTEACPGHPGAVTRIPA